MNGTRAPRATGLGASESNRPTCTRTTTGFSRVGALILRGCYARSVGAQCCSWVLLSSPPRSCCRLRGAMNLYLIIMMRGSCDNPQYHSYKYKYYKNNSYGICGIKQHVLPWRRSVREEKEGSIIACKVQNLIHITRARKMGRLSDVR